MDNKELELILNAIDEIFAQIKQLQKTIPEPSQSENLNELFSALAKTQSEMKIAEMNSKNPYFKNSYADLTDIVKASRPALTKNGLSVIQSILINDYDQNVLHTILAHSSGQWIESRIKILPLKPDVQSLGSYISYLKRYAYAALIGVVTSDNSDDDGEIAVHGDTNKNIIPKEQSYETITKEQLEELNYELIDSPDIAQMVLDGLKIQSLADMPKIKFLVSIGRIREIKNLRNNKLS